MLSRLKTSIAESATRHFLFVFSVSIFVVENKFRNLLDRHMCAHMAIIIMETLTNNSKLFITMLKSYLKYVLRSEFVHGLNFPDV